MESENIFHFLKPIQLGSRINVSMLMMIEYPCSTKTRGYWEIYPIRNQDFIRLWNKTYASRNLLAFGNGFPNTSVQLVEHGNIVSNFRLNLEWRDEFLSWNASQAKGIEDLRLDIEDIWVPDIDVYNLVSRKGLREREQVGF